MGLVVSCLHTFTLLLVFLLECLPSSLPNKSVFIHHAYLLPSYIITAYIFYFLYNLILLCLIKINLSLLTCLYIIKMLILYKNISKYYLIQILFLYFCYYQCVRMSGKWKIIQQSYERMNIVSNLHKKLISCTLPYWEKKKEKWL